MISLKQMIATSRSVAKLAVPKPNCLLNSISCPIAAVAATVLILAVTSNADALDFWPKSGAHRHKGISRHPIYDATPNSR